jgi:hypothetical protein
MLPHDEEGPCAGHRGILFTFLLSFVCRFVFFFGDLGFFVFQLFLQLSILGSAIFVADADPTMSSEALGGLPRAQATRQGSRVSGQPGQRKEKRSKGKEKEIAKLLHYCQIPNKGRNRGTAWHMNSRTTTYSLQWWCHVYLQPKPPHGHAPRPKYFI